MPKRAGLMTPSKPPRKPGLAAATGETNLVQRNEELLGFYRAHRPYHEVRK